MQIVFNVITIPTPLCQVRLAIAHWVIPETPNKRQATQHGCMPNLLGDGDKGIEIVDGEDKIFCSWPTRAAKARQENNLLYWHNKANEPNQERTPFNLYSLSPHSH